MEELLELKELLHQGKVAEALIIVEELEEMSKIDKLNKIFSYAIILLLHLIKKKAEKRTTKSWETSILNSVKQIQRSNQRRKAKGTYLTEEELLETIHDAYESALREAAIEAFEGSYEAEEISEMVDREEIIKTAIDLILERNNL
jgi:6-pyruvoyl-tetrahydropterin synthase